MFGKWWSVPGKHYIYCDTCGERITIDKYGTCSLHICKFSVNDKIREVVNAELDRREEQKKNDDAIKALIEEVTNSNLGSRDKEAIICLLNEHLLNKCFIRG